MLVYFFFFYPFTNMIRYLCILKSTKTNFLVHLDVNLNYLESIKQGC